VVLCFLGSAGNPDTVAALNAATVTHRALFDDDKVCLFCVSTDRDDQRLERLRASLPGIRIFWDFDRTVSSMYGADPGGPSSYVPFWLILDPMLRVLHAAPLAEAGTVMNVIAALPPCNRHAGVEVSAPVLVLPRVFEPDFCRFLIRLYQTHGGPETGFMREKDGVTSIAQDPAVKRRRDYQIQDETVKSAMLLRLRRRLVPEIGKAFQFRVTRLERFIVSCYDAAEGGHFRAHRDNTTKATAHRRFAVTINLNDDFDGGDLRFPEFGSRRYRPPVGGAVVFSCSLQHEVTRLTRGVRYATLPFLHDEAAEQVFQASTRGMVPSQA
jgi:hypothetical protein